MRNALAISAALLLGFTFTNCGRRMAGPTVNPAPIGNPQGTAGWTLRFESNCGEDVGPDSCVGKYGFSVMTDGQYQLGPGPQDILRHGVLSQEDTAELTGIITPLLSQAGGSSSNTIGIDAAATSDSVTLTIGTQAPVLLAKTDGSQMTYGIASDTDAKLLLVKMKSLAEKYYLLPFPDTCLDGAAALRDLQTSVRSCTTDSECGYFDESYETVLPESGQYLTTDDCSIVKPLVTGSRDRVNQSQDRLLELLNQIISSCGDRLVRSDCTEVKGLQLDGTPPKCVQGVCTLATSSSLR